MRRVLMLSYYFPPLGGIGSVRALKFAQYLPEFGWDPVVITPRKGAYHADASLAFDETKVVRTASLELSRAAKRVIGRGGDDTRAAEVGPVLGRLRSFARRWIYRPDGQIGWYPFALRAARRTLRERRCDVILSSSFPITAHLVARRLHQEFGIPWVAEFRDLWTDLTRYDSRRRQRLDEATERSVLTDATEVVSVSDAYASLLSERGGRRVAVITNGFDPADSYGAPVSSRPLATYVGTYYPDRQDLRTAIDGLGELNRSGALPGLRIRFVGECPASLRASLAEAGLADSVECTGFVTHGEALAHMQESTVLLLAGPVSGAFPQSTVRGNIASKAFEYLGSGRPILYVGDADCEVEALVGRFPGVACVRPGDVVGAREAILSLMQRGPTVERRGMEAFTRQALAGGLARILTDACREHSRG
jgi:glycosyltransferase involved in cell wall biosynthesis